jgi:hypothetical protein
VEFKSRRLMVFVCVLLLHGIIWTLLMRSSRLHLAVDQAGQTFAIEPLNSRRPEAVISRPTSNPATEPRSAAEMAEPRVGIDNEPAPSSAVTVPPVDWELEAETVARSTANPKLYRDLAGFTPAQFEWMRRNRMQPVPYNPFWDDGRHVGEPGVLSISDDCVIVNLLPVCRIKLGKRKVRGNLFKDMRKYLDERETDPLP